MTRGSVTISGLRELEGKMRQLPEAVRAEALKAAMEKAAAPIVAAAKANAPVLTGEVRASIGTTKPKLTAERVTIQVQPGSGFFIGDQYYAGFLEFGHFLGRRGKPGRPFVEPKPFLRPAVDSQGQTAVNIIVDEIALTVQAVFG